MKATKYVGTLLVAAACVMVGGCDAGDDGGQDQFVQPLEKVVQISEGPNGEEIVSFRDVEYNGVKFNGVRFNGIRFNGIRFNGIRFNGIRFNGIRFNGTAFNNARMGAHGGFEADDPSDNSATEMGPSDEIAVDMDDDVTGEDNEVKISEIENVPGKKFKFQRIRYRKRPSNTFEDVCFDNYENPTKGVLLQYALDDATGKVLKTPEGSTVWACRGTSLGKCIEWGWHPDEEAYDSRTGQNENLFDAFQTCSRMVRADYHGVGQHHTANGTPIDVADRYGMQSHETAWQIESAWGPDGALCLNTPRKLIYSKANIDAEGTPLPSCGTHDGTIAGRQALVDSWYDQGAILVNLNQAS